MQFVKQILVEDLGKRIVSPKTTSKYSVARTIISQDSFAPTGSKGYTYDGSIEKDPELSEKSEHNNSPPPLDDAKMDKFTYKQPIISFIKDLPNK